MMPVQQFYDRAAAALLALTTLFIGLTIVVPVVAAIVQDDVGISDVAGPLLISVLIAGVALAGVWLLRRKARAAAGHPAGIPRPEDPPG